MKKQFLQPRATPAREHTRKDDRYASQRARGFHLLRFSRELEAEYRASRSQGRTANIQRLYTAALLGLTAFLLMREYRGPESFVLAAAVVLGWIGLYLVAVESRRSFLLQGELRQQAHTDALTEAMNRRAFHDHLNLVWRQAEREGVSVGLVVLDLDHFKELNDRYGHQAGDKALRSTTEILKSYALRPLDAVGRFGGDEFVVVWYDAEPASFAALVQLLPAKVWMGLAKAGIRESAMTASGGAVLVWPGQEKTSIEDAIRIADGELYKVKRSGRGVIGLAQPLSPAAPSASAALFTDA